ncbi:TRAP transporter substrate-binding protein [Avibacterium paragallinarum]|uniref:TRAP transporter substrate-binding protein n=1 Tax=Avibacterium paragallinarum TaxID=728 RepID=UPI00021AD4F7|nr:TRAP transporter substrate-binding protein [Avibacterium paragallinarum]AZI13838.1 TRAP transporter substrate-binding protein [Avibacterium paragallinarum]QIR11842.1 TRAP transporter substrate-binding protein [Avibacterium paragallinarum]QJE09727.1 TRAP transporter substrate-binding protein [Avibacterium paragallinarum]QJE11923.1 TRAP transporter substrate-binding protein [Avibacterium paragallinarum]QJE14121.1 TRAP transporter substrate-binding protein [Avibacterium paragallinarum]
MKKSLLSTVLMTMLSMGIALSSQAKTTLKISHNNDKTHPVHLSMQHMADEVKQLTNGEVVIRIYPNSQLGSQRESMELLQAGSLDMAKSNASEMEAFEISYGAFNLPYLFQDREHYYRVLADQEVGQKILQNSKDKGFIGLTYYDGGARSFYANKPIKSPEDLKGMKIRVQPSPTAVEMIKLMGASPTPLAYGELYTALQQKVVDGAENNETALTLARHGEVAKYFSEDEHTMIPDVLLISLKSWNKLTPEQQKILKQAADNSMLYHKEIWTKMIAEERAKAQKQLNVQFVPVDKTPFVQAVKTMHDTAKQNPALKPYIERIETLK